MLRITYRVLAVLVLCYALWGIGRLVLDVNQPMGGFIWYYDEAVSGGWIVNQNTGLDWPGCEAGLQRGDRILAIEGRPADEFGEIYATRALGDRLSYRVQRDGQELVITDVPIVRFTWGMFLHSQLIMFAVGIIFWALSVFVHGATPESETSYAFSLFALFAALPFFFHSFSVSVNTPHYPQAVSFLTWKPVFALAAATAVHFATLFPTQTLPLPWGLKRHHIRRGAYITAGFLMAFYLIASLPLGLQRWEALAYALNLGSLFVGLLLCALLFAYVAGHSASFVARQQALWMLGGWGINALQLLPLLIDLIAPQALDTSWNLITFLGAAIPLSVTYAIIRYRLFHTRLFLLRALRFFVPVFGFIFLYLPLTYTFNRLAWFHRLRKMRCGR